MSLNLGAITNETFPQDWTVFYWAWWIGYASLIGMFTARISKGRTIRQIILTQCLVGPVGTWVFFGVFGNYALNLELSNILPVLSILESGGQTEAIMAVTNTLPLSVILIPLFAIAYLVFSATTFDSASLILASVASKKLDKAGQPPRYQRLLWAFVLGVMGVTVLAIGGLEAVQLSSVIIGVPMILVFTLMTIAFIKTVRKDFIPKQTKPALTRNFKNPESDSLKKEA